MHKHCLGKYRETCERKQLAIYMGLVSGGDQGTSPLHFLGTGDKLSFVPPTFSELKNKEILINRS